jgi:ankyrin repeat protein
MITQMAFQHNATIHLIQPLKSKAKRERASWQQKLILEKIFDSNQYPDLTVRTQLSDQLDMSPRKIQIWFQNRRTKAKQKNAKEEEVELDINEPLKNGNGNTFLAIACSLGHVVVPKLLAKGTARKQNPK